MKVLMLGWEFPPYFAGGVGIACYELTKVLSDIENIEIEYVMAYGPDERYVKKNMKISSANKVAPHISKVTITKIETTLYAYDTPESYERRFLNILQHKNGKENPGKSVKEIYGKNIIEEVYLYAQRVAQHFQDKDFDVIHAHDWTTIPAALLLKKLTGKPVIFHVHITELDKTGGNGGWEKVFEIERDGFDNSDILIAVSNFVRNRLVNDYKIDSKKIRVIHNGGISDLTPSLFNTSQLLPQNKLVLFAGRMTLQKGPEYFLHAAKKVLEYEPTVNFVLIGNGDLLTRMIELCVDLGISKNVYFHGSYTRAEAEEFFSRADVFVMPSVSEPFGIVPLEAVVKGTPTIISKQSGISEVLSNSLKVDFWDTHEMAHKILAYLNYPHLHGHIKENAFRELSLFDWRVPAKKCVDAYKELVYKTI